MTRSEVRFKIFGAVCIPLQFLIVWVCYFGFTIEPNVFRVIQVFNIAGITKAALNFWQLIPIAFTVQNSIDFLMKAMPYLLWLAVQCAPAIVFLIAFIQLLRYIIAIISKYSHEWALDIKTAFVIKYGPPGTGKSSTAGYECVHLAAKMWGQVQYKRWLMEPFLREWKQTNNIEKLNEWDEVWDAYIFWATKDCIPCLAANIPVIVKGQYAVRLTRDHIYQRTRLPAFTVLYIDEISAMVDVTNSGMDRPLEVTELFRWARHFGFIVIATEQDKDRVQIDMRRVAGQTFLMLNQKGICKPLPIVFINWLLKLIPIFTGYNKANKPLSRVLLFSKKLIDYTGFRRFTYRMSETETGSGSKSRKKSFCLPSMLNYKYDDRTFREFYEPLKQPVEYDIFSSLKMPEEHKQAFIHKTKRELSMENEEYVNLAKAVYANSVTDAQASVFLDRQKKEQTLVTKLFDEDVFAYMKKIVDEAESGSKASHNVCRICGKPSGKYVYCQACNENRYKKTV